MSCQPCQVDDVQLTLSRVSRSMFRQLLLLISIRFCGSTEVSLHSTFQTRLSDCRANIDRP